MATFRINVGYQQSVACCSKLTKLLVKVLVEIINVNITNYAVIFVEKNREECKILLNFLNKNNSVFAFGRRNDVVMLTMM